MPNPSQTPAKSPDENKCQHANRHMTYPEYAIWEMYRGLAASTKNKTRTVAISNENMARLFKGGSRQVVGRIIKSLVAAGWLETVQNSKYVAEHKRTPIEYRALSHEAWIVKHPGACPDLAAKKDENPDPVEPNEQIAAATPMTIPATPMTIPATPMTIGGTQATIPATPMTMPATVAMQTATPITNVSLSEPIKELISKSISNPTDNLMTTRPQDDRVESEDLRDLDSRELCQLPAAETLQEQIERMKEGTQDQKTSPPKSPSRGGIGGAAAAVAAAPARPAQTFIPHSPFDCVDFSGESGLEFDESRLSGFLDHPAIELPESLKTNEDLLKEAGWEL